MVEKLLKFCKKCGGTDFKARTNPDGSYRTSECRSCSKAAAKVRSALPVNIEKTRLKSAESRRKFMYKVEHEGFIPPPCKHCGGIIFTAQGSCKICLAESSARSYIENKDKISIKGALRYIENREDILAKCSIRYEKYPEKHKSKRHNRRALAKGADGTFTEQDLLDICTEQDYKCVYCQIDIRKGTSVDHIIALANNGSNWPANLQMTCLPCNISKPTKTHAQFMAFRKKLGRYCHDIFKPGLANSSEI